MAEHLRDEEHCDVAYVGAPDSLEERLAGEAGMEFHAVPAKGFDRGAPLSLVSAALTTVLSLPTCLGVLRRTRPEVVIGFGGYVSLPLGLAAAMAGIPLVLHEQNAVPGMTNKLLSRWARTVCVTYATSVDRLAHPSRAFVTGNPVRSAVARADRAAGRKVLKLRKADLVLLVFGGSRGARHLNTAMLSLYKRLKDIPKLRIIHVAGPAEIESVSESLKALAPEADGFWRALGYIEAMGDALAAADLVVCRAGATTLAELAALGRPSVLVPYPYATDDHQALNATALVAAGAASTIPDVELDTQAFGDEIVRLLTDSKTRADMAASAHALARPMAAHAVAEAAIEAAVERRRILGVPAKDAL
ncbi:MAG: undecaprenyldiphospho-muramoylpentapeptide beta-N-acetylglucosaminyltransferase [Coriobacteriia bacterium]|nr:undecaprenyldiphospho-muramoylpentapeptide beta-N-acetylglucosaminyltransferase [Coriobacteriia bacterium]